MAVGGVGSGNQPGSGTEGPDGPGGPQGPQPGGGEPEGPTGTEGGAEGDVFGSEFGFEGMPPDAPPGETGGDDLAARQLCNTIALNNTTNDSARAQIVGTHDTNVRGDRTARDESSTRREADNYRSDARTETRTADLGEALMSGDRRAIDSFFKNVMGGNRSGESNRPPPGSGTPTQPTVPNPGAGTTTRTPPEGRTPTPTANPPPAPPVLPGSTGRLANLTQPRMDSMAGRIANMPPGPQKTEAQQLETRLRAAIAEGNHEEAAQILEQLSAMGIDMGGEEGTEEVGEGEEVAEGEEAGEGEGTGEGGGVRREGEGATPRTASVRLSHDHLEQGVMVFSGGGGPRSEENDHLTRMGTGLRTICGGEGTRAAARLSTDDAVRGLYDEGSGDGDGASGGGSRDSSVEFGSMVDTDGALADSGLRLDTAAAGIGGAYGVRTEDGRFIPQWMAMSEHGGLPPGVRSAIARDAGLRTRFGAEAVSGARAGTTGDLWAGMRC